MPENLGDMGGNMDDMSGNSILNRLRRGQQYEEEAMPEERFNPDMPRPVPMPTPDMPRRPDGREFMPVPMPTPKMPRNYEFLNSGGRVGYEGGDLVDMEDVILASTKGKKK